MSVLNRPYFQNEEAAHSFLERGLQSSTFPFLREKASKG